MKAWLRGLTADQAIKAGTAAVVLAVGSFAAVVSYSHIYDLAGAAVPGRVRQAADQGGRPECALARGVIFPTMRLARLA